MESSEEKAKKRVIDCMEEYKRLIKSGEVWRGRRQKKHTWLLKRLEEEGECLDPQVLCDEYTARMVGHTLLHSEEFDFNDFNDFCYFLGEVTDEWCGVDESYPDLSLPCTEDEKDKESFEEYLDEVLEYMPSKDGPYENDPPWDYRAFHQDVWDYMSGEVPNEFLEDEDIASKVVYINSDAFFHLPKNLQDLERIAHIALQGNGEILEDVSEKLKNNFDIVLSAMEGDIDGESIFYVPERFIREEKFLRKIYETSPFYQSHYSAEDGGYEVFVEDTYKILESAGAVEEIL